MQSMVISGFNRCDSDRKYELMVTNRYIDVVTRSYKQNDRDHAGLADGTADDIQHLPRYFAKSGHVDADPKKVKKEGSGKGNW